MRKTTTSCVLLLSFLIGFIFFAGFSEADNIATYDELLTQYSQNLSSAELNTLRETVKGAEQNAFEQILRKELNATFSERQYILQRSKESIPTKQFSINDDFVAIGFEKTVFRKRSWEKTAYILLFEFKDEQDLEFTGSYLFWRGDSAVNSEYKTITMKSICQQFSMLTKIKNCGEGPTRKVAKVEKKKTPPPPPPKQKTTSQTKPPQTTATKVDSSISEKLSELDNKIDRVESEVERKADKRHKHNGRDIVAGIIDESFIDASIARDREFKSKPADVSKADVSSDYVNELENRVMQLEQDIKQLTYLLRGVYRNNDTILFEGVNLQIVNGTGSTNGHVNGLGNLIVGYNEPRGDGEVNDRTGSHNLVVGGEHNYTSYGGIVSGLSNTISGIYANVNGGAKNEASGHYSTVIGGHFITTKELYDVVPTNGSQTGTNDKKGGCGGCGGCN